MATQEENAFQEALNAIHNGDKSRARDLLTRLIKINANNPQYWLYMSAVVETPRELVFCLKEALKRDPKNFTARRGLMLQGELPGDPDLVVPLNLQRRNWEAQFFAGQPIPGLIENPSRLRLGLILGALAVLIIVIAVVIVGYNRPEVPVFIAWLQRYTPAPTSSTPIVNTLVPTSSPTTLVRAGTPSFVLITATPTALYINTPHPRTESYRSAVVAFQKSDWSGAVTFLLQAIKEDPKPDLYYLLGESYRNLKKPKEALQAFDQAVQIDPRFAPSYLGRARLRMLTAPEQSDVIRSDLERSISLDNNLSEAVYELVAFKINHKEAGSALRDLEALMQMQPESPLPYFYRARANLTLNQTAQAVSDARKASQLDPGSLAGYRLLAETLRANNDPGGAIMPLELYTRYVLDDAEALGWLGQCYASQGNNVDALRLLEQAIGVNPQSFEARISRAAVFIDMKEPKKAQEELRTANTIRPDAFPVYLGLGRVSLLNDDSSEAWRNFTGALRLAQTDTERAQVYYWRAIALELGKQIIQAVSDWNDLLRLPIQAVPAGLRDSALLHIQALATATNTPRPSTATISPTSSRTSTLTVSPTSSRTSTITLTSTATSTITPTLLTTASSTP